MMIELSSDDQVLALKAVIDKLNKQIDYLCWQMEHNARDADIDNSGDRPLCPEGVRTECKADKCSECWKKYSEEYALKKMKK